MYNITLEIDLFSVLLFNKIIDGYGIMPFTFDDIKFVPQLFYKLYFLPYGIQSTQIHINNWTEKDFREFEYFIKKMRKKSLMPI